MGSKLLHLGCSRPAVLLFLVSWAASAQTTGAAASPAPPVQQTAPPTPNTDLGKPLPTGSGNPAGTGATAAPASNAREAQLRTDTERLLQLTRELKAEVDKSSKDTLSISVLRKAEEVEKLAKSLKDRMKEK